MSEIEQILEQYRRIGFQGMVLREETTGDTWVSLKLGRVKATMIISDKEKWEFYKLPTMQKQKEWLENMVSQLEREITRWYASHVEICYAPTKRRM